VRFFNHLAEKKIPVIVGSILEKKNIEEIKKLSPDGTGTFDVIHSWGVLHHTGNMREAIQNSAQLVKPEDYLLLPFIINIGAALYGNNKTNLLQLSPLCSKDNDFPVLSCYLSCKIYCYRQKSKERGQRNGFLL